MHGSPVDREMKHSLWLLRVHSMRTARWPGVPDLQKGKGPPGTQIFRSMLESEFLVTHKLKPLKEGYTQIMYNTHAVAAFCFM
jgi:hypothetical protein